MTADLLAAIDSLTKPRTVVNWQHQHQHEFTRCAGLHGTERCTIEDCPLYVCQWCGLTVSRAEAANPAKTGSNLAKRTDQPLLDQLRQAIHSNIGERSTSGRSARERTPLDVGAFDLYNAIDAKIRGWVTDLDKPPEPRADPINLLRHWYVLWSQKPRHETNTAHYTQTVNGWAQAIEDLLDPPTRQEITSPCPVCGKEWVVIGEGREAESTRALWAVWRETAYDSYAVCKSCGRVWIGVPRMRALRIMIDEQEAERHAAEKEAQVVE